MRKLTLCILLLAATAFAIERQPLQDYKARRQAAAKAAGSGTIVLFAPTEEEGPNALYGFQQEAYFYYLTGWLEPGAAVLISPERPAAGERPAQPYTEILFLPGRNASQERWTGPKLTAESANARQATGFDRVEALDKLRDELVRVLPSPRALVYSDLGGFGEKSNSVQPLQWLQRANSFPNYVSFAEVRPLLDELRVRKDNGEIALLRKATDASAEAHRAAMRAVKPGVTELEISALMQYEFGRRGCEKPGYAPIVGAGFNSTVLHYSQNSGTMQAGDLVVMDVGGQCSMYVADITRTLPVSGKFTPRQREIYNIVLGALEAAIAAYQPGKSTIGRGGEHSLYKAAYDYINTHGKDQKGQPLGQYFIHGLSHFVGLDVHDVGDGSRPLPKGAVFTIEPGIYIPEEKLGVRIEDMFYIDENGRLVNLTQTLVRTADEIEGAMAKQ